MSATLLRISMRTNAVSRTTDATRETMTLVSPQCETPLALVAALDSPQTSAATAGEVGRGPPALGPPAGPPMLMAAYTPMARLRGGPSGKVVVTRARAVGAMI